jgi:hypothetical protein
MQQLQHTNKHGGGKSGNISSGTGHDGGARSGDVSCGTGDIVGACAEGGRWPDRRHHPIALECLLQG